MLHAIGLHALGLQTVVDALQAILQESDYIALTALCSGRVAPVYLPCSATCSITTSLNLSQALLQVPQAARASMEIQCEIRDQS